MGDQGQRDELTAAPLAAVAAAVACLPPSSALAVGVSGGPDSAALAWLLAAARPDLHLTLVHVRHGLRDDAADASAAAGLAQQLSRPLHVHPVHVRRAGEGPEAAARTARYTALRAAAAAAGASVVAVGHTADDQAETVLLNIARGSGLTGLSGMPARRDLDGFVLLRPLLGLRRETVRAVTADQGLPAVADPSNDDPQQRRARARSQLLPLLASLTGGGSDPVAALSRLAAAARSDAEALDSMAAASSDELLRSWGPVCCIRRAALSRLPVALARRVVRGALAATAAAPADPGAAPADPGERPTGHGATTPRWPPAAAVDAALALAPGAAAQLAGPVLVTLGDGWLAFAPPVDRRPPLPQRALGAGIDLPELGLRVCCAETEPSAAVVGKCPPDPGQAVLPPWAPSSAPAVVAVAAGAPLVVRARRRGEALLTSSGPRPLSAALAAAGVPRAARDLLPIVADSDGPVWAPGVGVRAGVSGPRRLWLERR